MYTIIQNVIKKLISAFIVGLDGLIHKVKEIYVVEDGVIKKVPFGETSTLKITYDMTNLNSYASDANLEVHSTNNGTKLEIQNSSNTQSSKLVTINLLSLLGDKSSVNVEFDYSSDAANTNTTNYNTIQVTGGSQQNLMNGSGHWSGTVTKSGSYAIIKFAIKTGANTIVNGYIDISNMTIDGEAVTFEIEHP